MKRQPTGVDRHQQESQRQPRAQEQVRQHKGDARLIRRQELRYGRSRRAAHDRRHRWQEPSRRHRVERLRLEREEAEQDGEVGDQRDEGVDEPQTPAEDGRPSSEGADNEVHNGSETHGERAVEKSLCWVAVADGHDLGPENETSLNEAGLLCQFGPTPENQDVHQRQ